MGQQVDRSRIAQSLLAEIRRLAKPDRHGRPSRGAVRVSVFKLANFTRWLPEGHRPNAMALVNVAMWDHLRGRIPDELFLEIDHEVEVVIEKLLHDGLATRGGEVDGTTHPPDDWVVLTRTGAERLHAGEDVLASLALDRAATTAAAQGGELPGHSQSGAQPARGSVAAGSRRSEDGPTRQSDFEYDIALSFAGEDRVFVRQVAEALRAAGVNVFFDEFEEAALWGKNLYDHLTDVYRKKARFCLLFASTHYARKVWPSHERQSAQARALEEKGEYILPARFDDTEIPGLLPTVGYIDLRTTGPARLADLALAKLGRTPAPKAAAPILPPATPPPASPPAHPLTEADRRILVQEKIEWRQNRTAVVDLDQMAADVGCTKDDVSRTLRQLEESQEIGVQEIGERFARVFIPGVRSIRLRRA